jgi:hypothetical protein
MAGPKIIYVDSVEEAMRLVAAGPAALMTPEELEAEAARLAEAKYGKPKGPCEKCNARLWNQQQPWFGREVFTYSHPSGRVAYAWDATRANELYVKGQPERQKFRPGDVKDLVEHCARNGIQKQHLTHIPFLACRQPGIMVHAPDYQGRDTAIMIDGNHRALASVMVYGMEPTFIVLTPEEKAAVRIGTDLPYEELTRIEYERTRAIQRQMFDADPELARKYEFARMD